MQEERTPVKEGKGFLFWMFILALVVLLGIFLFPYVVWTLAGPMPSMG